jgi:hypothetical protein
VAAELELAMNEAFDQQAATRPRMVPVTDAPLLTPVALMLGEAWA